MAKKRLPFKKTPSAKKKSPARNAPPEKKSTRGSSKIPVERIQLGVRMEKRMVKVLKAMAEFGDMSLGELLEAIVLHSFEGGSAQTFGPQDIRVISEFKKVYGMNYDVHTTFKEP